MTCTCPPNYLTGRCPMHGPAIQKNWQANGLNSLITPTQRKAYAKPLRNSLRKE